MMSARGNFGPRQRGPSQGYSRRNPGRPDNYYDGNFAHHDGYMQHYNRPPLIPPPLIPAPQLGNTNASPYQITLSFNAPPTHGQPYPNPIHPPQGGHGMIHSNPPPPYMEVPPPPSSHLHAQKPPPYTYDSVGDKRTQEGPMGRGRGNRMRGKFSQSCGNLNVSNSYETDKDKSHKTGGGDQSFAHRGQRGQGFKGSNRGGRGHFKHHRDDRRTSHSSVGADLSENNIESDCEDDGNSDVSSERSFKQGGSSRRGGRESRGKDGFQGRRGRGRGQHNRGGRKHSSPDRHNELDSDNEQQKEKLQTKKSKGRKSSDHQTDARNSQHLSSSKTPNTHLAAKPKGIMQDVSVTLKFDTCFDCAATLTKHIESTLQLPAGDDFECSYDYDHISLRRKDNQAICKVTMSGCSVNEAKKCIHKMVSALIEKLDVSIDVKFDETQGDDKDASSGGRNAKKGAVPPPNKKQTRSKSAAAVSKISDENNTDCTALPVPSVVFLNIEKPFSSGEDFKGFLIHSASALPFDLIIDDKSISLSGQFSECLIHTQSKADAKRLTQLFLKLQTRGEFKMTCSMGDVKDKTALKIKTHCENVRTSITTEKSEFLQKHDKIISHLNTEIRKLSKDRKEDLFALQDKLSAALKQRDQFLAFCEMLEKNLETLDQSKVQTNDIQRLKLLFDRECHRLNKSLPIYACRDEIVQHLKYNQVTIIEGESGCGKSTQIAQYLYDAGYADNGVIVHTQPEQLSVITTAEKTAKELSVKIGSLVGFKTVRLNKANKKSKILFSTDQSLLNEFLNDAELKNYSCIIVDGAHEHRMHTDLLLGMIKCSLYKRHDLKVIILLPPNQLDVFGKYFNIDNMFRVSSRHFGVDVSFSGNSSEDFKDYEAKAVAKAIQVHKEEDMGDMLIFLSQPMETIRCCQEFERGYSGDKGFKCLPLHHQLPPQEMKKIFESLPDGQRKIIFTTKYAETLSIDGVQYIIDSGATSEMKYDSEQKVNLVKTCVENQTSAEYRKNCAGHSAGGKCYRLFSKEFFDNLATEQVPEILRVHLEKAVLKILELGVNLRGFDFVHAPSSVALSMTLDTLTQYGAFNNGKITDVGRWISKLPFDPKLGFLICEADKKDLLYDAIVLASIVSFGSDFSYRNLFETEADVESRNQKIYGRDKMDCFAWLQVYKIWSELSKTDKPTWCRTHSVNYKLINLVHECIEGVKATLLKDFGKKCTDKFSDRPDAPTTLKKVYLKSRHPHFSTM